MNANTREITEMREHTGTFDFNEKLQNVAQEGFMRACVEEDNG